MSIFSSILANEIQISTQINNNVFNMKTTNLIPRMSMNSTTNNVIVVIGINIVASLIIAVN